MRNKIIFYLNGKRKEVGAQEASMMLAEYLRYDQSLTGTKIVCAEGDCGACSVLRYFPHIPQGTDSQNYLAINSCITTVAQLDGSSLVTVDALAEEGTLHESQRAMVDCHGSQCGFCTPGFVMAITGLVEEKLAKKEVAISPREAMNCMTGNLCRCTGYQPIVAAAMNVDLAKCQSLKGKFYSSTEAQDLSRAFKESVLLESPEFTFFAPKTIKEALNFLADHPDTRILGSATDLGVVHNKRKIKLTKLLSLHLVEELYRMEASQNFITIGARVTLTELRHFLKDKVQEFSTYLDVFASPQIKNIATLVGNVANASPIGDTPPALLALNASVELTSKKGVREILLSDFFLGYRKTALGSGEIITAVKFPLPGKNSSLKFYKIANRKDLDISAVNLAVKIDWADHSKKEILDVTLAAGGVAAIPLRLKKTEQFLKSNSLNKASLEAAIKELHAEFNPLSDLRASAAYRHVLVENFFRRFFSEVGGLS